MLKECQKIDGLQRSKRGLMKQSVRNRRGNYMRQKKLEIGDGEAATAVVIPLYI